MSEDDLDPASYEYWRESGYRSLPPWRRGDRWGYFAISLGRVGLIVGAAGILAHAA